MYVFAVKRNKGDCLVVLKLSEVLWATMDSIVFLDDFSCFLVIRFSCKFWHYVEPAQLLVCFVSCLPHENMWLVIQNSKCFARVCFKDVFVKEYCFDCGNLVFISEAAVWKIERKQRYLIFNVWYFSHEIFRLVLWDSKTYLHLFWISVFWTNTGWIATPLRNSNPDTWGCFRTTVLSLLF